MTSTVQELKRRDNRLDRVRILLGLIAVTLLGMLVWSVFASHDDAEQARTETISLAQQVTAACSAGGAAERELESIGACEKAATAAMGAPVADQAPIIQVATDDQVRSAVADYLQAHPPRDGRTPTAAEVDAAVTRVCDEIGCRGADGTDGLNGQDGQDGADATDDQVAAQVDSYCGKNNGCLPTAAEIQAAVAAYCSAQPSPCVGPQGSTGERGEPGPILPEVRITDALTGTTKHCVLQPPADAAEPPHYECTLE